MLTLLLAVAAAGFEAVDATAVFFFDFSIFSFSLFSS